MNDNEVSVFTVADMAYSSLWFLGSCMQQENWSRTVEDVYNDTIGKAEIKVPTMNVGTALLGAYSLFVLPRGLLFDEFSKEITGKNLIDWTGFTWAEPDKFGPDATIDKWKDVRSDHNVLGGIRNALAHANFEIENDQANELVLLHLWSQSDENSAPKRNVRVSPQQLASFVMRFHDLFVKWHQSGKQFPAPAEETIADGRE